MKYRGIMPAFVYPPSGVPVTFMESMHMCYQAGVFSHKWTAGTSSRTNAVRTMNGENFLASDAEWIFLVDTDMVWEPKDIIRLRDTARKLRAKAISGWALVMKDGMWPHAYRKDDHGYVPWGFIDPFSAPLVVDAVGGACFLVHREVYEAVRDLPQYTAYLWQEETYNDFYDIQTGEDIAFCDKITRAGFEIWYEPDAIFTHIKPTPFGPAEYKTFTERLYQRLNMERDVS